MLKFKRKIRKSLEILGMEERHRFYGEVSKFGYKDGYCEILPTIMLRNITLYGENKILTGHLWFVEGKQFQSLDLKEGDLISFDARVAQYVKGYLGDELYFFEINGYFPPEPYINYKLERPTKIRIEKRATDIPPKAQTLDFLLERGNLNSQIYEKCLSNAAFSNADAIKMKEIFQVMENEDNKKGYWMDKSGTIRIQTITTDNALI